MSDIFNTLDQNYIKFENSIIHVIIDKYDKLWFHANNLANALGYVNIKEALRQHIDPNDKLHLFEIKHNLILKGSQPNTTYISEAGMYKLILTSRMPKAKKFNNWVTNDVLPSIRKYGSYKLKKEYENEMDNLLGKINDLEKQNKKMQNELKKEKYPSGGVVYAIDYSDDHDEIYRIGMTGDMDARKQIYDTHSLYKHKVIIIEQSKCPVRLETCIRAMLYDYRYKNKKDFYLCGLNIVKRAFRTCINSIECMNQKGGGNSDDFINKIKNRVNRLQNKINKLDIMLNS